MRKKFKPKFKTGDIVFITKNNKHYENTKEPKSSVYWVISMYGWIGELGIIRRVLIPGKDSGIKGDVVSYSLVLLENHVAARDSTVIFPRWTFLETQLRKATKDEIVIARL